MNRAKTLLLIKKIFRKLKFGKFGGVCVYLLNKYINAHKAVGVDSGDCVKLLNSVHKDVFSSSLYKNEIIDFTCDLQIIIPVYNTSNFIKDCINSCLTQKTKYKYHLVIVNDGSTDDSDAVLSQYVSDNRITIISQANKGFSGARNTGLKRIFGRYITFLDSDDVLAPNAISNWLDAAYKYDADVVEGSYRRRTTNGKLYGGVKLPKESIEDNIKMQGYACMKIFKSDIWKNIHFPEGYWYEDTIMYGLILPKVKVYVQIPDYVYYYTANRGSISYTSNGKKKSLDGIYILPIQF